MKLAFCLFNYFPHGGLQRDFMRIVRVCKQRGHEVHVYTMKWEGEKEPDIHLHLLPASGWQNHTRLRSFARQLAAALHKPDFDLIVGFNKMPGLDVYYAADVCYQSRVHGQRRFLYKLSPRYRQLIHFENKVFAKGNKTEILLISGLQQREFTHYYQTEAERFHLLPPGIARDRIAPANANDIRGVVRQSLGLAEDNYLLLLIGSGFKTKGLDRALRGVADLPQDVRSRTQFYIIGDDRAAPFIKLAKKLGIASQVHFTGGRDDIPDFLLAGDLLLHPAYHENTGTVLLEAMASGLPVLTVENCGYAHYISESKSGVVLSVPFQQRQFNDALKKILLSKECKIYKQNGLAFARRADIYNMPGNAADFIENMAEKRASASTREH